MNIVKKGLIVTCREVDVTGIMTSVNIMLVTWTVSH